MKQSFKVVKLSDVCNNETSNLTLKNLENNFGQYSLYGASGFIKNIDFYKQDRDYIGIVKDGAGIGRVMLLEKYSSILGTMQYIIPKENINIKYLYYNLIKMNLSKYFTGSTIPHIYFKDYKNEKIFLRTLSEQKKISSILDKTSKILEMKKQQLSEFDNLVKFQFLKMFSEKNSPYKNWNEIFETKTGKLDSNAMVENGKYPFFTCAKEIYKINNYAFDCEALLLAGNNAVGKYDVKYYKGKFNAYQRTYVLTLINQEYSYRFFKIQLENKLSFLQNSSKGSNTKYLTLEILKRLKFIIPPIELQNKFAEFVKQVDKSKVELQKSIDETQLLFDSLMDKYFG